MLSFLPNRFQLYLNELDLSKIYEIRIRTGFGIKINLNNSYFYLGNGSVICTSRDIDEIIENVTERSLYAFNESLKQGYLTTKNGVRIGVAGECVYDNGEIITIKNITSLNIRVPHFINGCSNALFTRLFCEDLPSVLIVSPPFYGKTTILKDLILNLDKLSRYSILVVDERCEFAELSGNSIDNIKYGNKNFAFTYGIRSMSPNVIVTDELSEIEDWKSVKNTINSGVKVIASCHSENAEQLRNKDFFIKDLFDYYVFLDSKCGKAGVIKYYYDKDFNII